MDATFDNSNGATLDNLNQDIFQKSSVLTDGDLDMDIKYTNITSQAIDTLNNIQSYTIDNQKSSEIIDQNRISNDDYIIDENNQHSHVHNAAPLNGKASEFNASDNYFGPESNVDDDTTGSPVTEEFNERNDDDDDDIENIDIVRPDELVAPHGIHFENIDYLKTVDEVEECDSKRDVDVADHHERNFECEDFDNERQMFTVIDTPIDLVAESIKLVDAVLPEKVEDPIEDPIQPENVIVPESGEESEDEWNYIKVNQNANDTETQERNNISHETVESQNLCPDLVNDNQTQDDEIVGIEEASCMSEADMASMLNPDAKEFVPTSPSPTNTTPVNSIDISGIAANMATLRLNLEDELVSQSPRKGTENPMVDDAPVPEENDFLNDITQRPADLDSTVMSDIRPGSSSSQCSYQEMNLKEAMHGDEKQEYAHDVMNTPDQVAFEMGSTNGDHEEFINILNKSMRNQDVMNASFYNDGTSDSNNPFKVDLNAVHRLPTSDDENEDERVEATTTGTKYSFEDTGFGMSDFVQTEPTELLNGAAGIENGVSVAEPESNDSDSIVGAGQESIVGAVQEMISENLAVLSECDLAIPEPSAPTIENMNAVTEVEEPVVVAELISLQAENSFEPTAVNEPAVLPVVSNLISEEYLQPNIVAESEIVAQSEIVAESDIVAQSESIVEANVSNDVVAETETIVETLVPDTAAVAVGGVAAVAAVGDTVAATTKGKSTKPAEPKSKTASSVAATAKKPLSAGVTAKPKAKPSTVSDAKSAPIPRPRTAASQPPVKAIEKKPATSLAPKKPVNGDVKPTSTLTTAKRPVSSTTTLKSTTSARATTATTTTTTTKVTAARLTTKTSTTTTTADAPKRIATTKTTTTTSSTLKPRLASSTLTRSPISKANTSATDKSTKDTVNKLQTSGARAPVSPRSATTTSRTVPLKKADAAKVPSVPAPIKRPISSTQEKRAPIAPATANGKLVPTQKRPMSTLTNRATTLETVKKTTSTSTLKKDAKSPANGTNEPAPKENGNETNGTHAFDMPTIESNDAVNVEPEPVLI